MHGITVPRGGPAPIMPGAPESQYQEDYFVYGIGPLALAPGASGQGSIQIQADSLFQWERAAYYVDIAGAAFTESTRPIPNITIQIVDSGSGRQLFQTAQALPSLFGTGELPFVLPTPRWFKPNSQIQIQLVNFGVGTTYNVRLSFIGSKVFEFKG